MARLNTGKNSVRIDVTVSPELYEAVENWMTDNDKANVSEVVRVALAELVGQPELAGEMKRGRRWPPKTTKRKTAKRKTTRKKSSD